MERKDLSKMPLEKILSECAALSKDNNNLKTVLKEFYYFIGSEQYFEIKEKCTSIGIDGIAEAEKLRREALLFYEYCLGSYGK